MGKNQKNNSISDFPSQIKKFTSKSFLIVMKLTVEG